MLKTSAGQALLLVAISLAAGVVLADRLPTLILLGINAIIILGLTLFMGHAGQISIGHAAFFGIGAYTAAIVTTRYGWSPWLGILAAAIGAGVIAYMIGKPSLRLRGHYLAMATLGFGEIIHALMNQLKGLTNGTDGIGSIPTISIGGLSFDSKQSFYYLVWLFVAVILFICLNVVRSRVGRALRAVHGSEIAAQAMGVDTAKYKIQVFVMSAVFAGIAGSLFAFYMSFISPESFTITESVVLVTMVVVGGMSSLWGGILGAGLLTLLEEYLRDYLEYSFLIYGTLLVMIMIFMPNGLAGAGRMAYGYLKHRFGLVVRARKVVNAASGTIGERE